MKRLLHVLAALALGFSVSSGASAAIVNALPYNFTNGSTADATQVMANYNQIVDDVNNNAAHNTVNSDITSLTGLTTALPPSEGGTVAYTGGTTAGTTNAQTLATVVPAAFTLTAGNFVTGIAGASVTSASTLAVNGTTAKAIKKITASGLADTATGDIIIGGQYTWMYDGTQYQLLNPTPAAVTYNVLLNVQTFTSTGAGTYTPTAGMSKCVIRMCGPGGGSGGSTGAGGQSATSGAGGGGACMEILATAANIGASAALNIGPGGVAGSSGNNAGQAGASNTTITINSSTWTAGSGQGGGGETSSAAAQISGTPGAGGTNTTGANATLLSNWPGQIAGYGQANGAVGGGVSSWGGKGGDSQFGRGAGQVVGGCSAGNLYGGGANGYYNASGSNQAGCAGANGYITVAEFK